MPKTWGPFTGRQLTAIIIALGVVVMVPGGAYAVATFTNVALEDPSSGVRASVDSTHHLRVGDGSGALTVDGSVYVRPLAPTRPWRFSLDTSANLTIWVGPSSLPIDVTSLTVSIKSGTTVDLFLYQVLATADGTACDLATGNQGTIYHVQIPNNTPLVISFPTPLVLTPPAGQKVCLVGNNGNGLVVTANGVGFYG